MASDRSSSLAWGILLHYSFHQRSIDRSIHRDDHHFHNLLVCILNRNLRERCFPTIDVSLPVENRMVPIQYQVIQWGVWWVIKLIIAELDYSVRIADTSGHSSGFAVPSNNSFEECDSLNEFYWWWMNRMTGNDRGNGWFDVSWSWWTMDAAQHEFVSRVNARVCIKFSSFRLLSS